MRPARRAVVGKVKIAGHDPRAKRMAKLIHSGKATVHDKAREAPASLAPR